MRIELGTVLAHDGKTIGFDVVEGPDKGLGFPVTFVPEDASPERDVARGIATPGTGIDVMRRDSLVVVTSLHDLQVNLAGGHKLIGRTFIVRFEHHRFVLEVC